MNNLTKYSLTSLLNIGMTRDCSSKQIKAMTDRKPAILYVDDEEKCLKYFKLSFQDQFRIFTASNAHDGYELFKKKQNEIGVLITDQQMPNENGVHLLEKSLQLKPNIVRLLVTAYSDMNAVIDAINLGSVHRYITKPWDLKELAQLLNHSLELFIQQNEQEKRMHDKSLIVRNQSINDRAITLGSLAANLSHHINNALVAVRVFLDLAPDKLEQEKKGSTDIEDTKYWVNMYQRAKSQVGRITELLTDLESAPEEPNYPFKNSIKINELIPQIISFLEPRLTEKKIDVTCEIPNNLPHLIVDQTKFRKLFRLLLQDEINHLPEGKNISIRACLITEKKGLDPKIQITLKSNGPPLPREMIRALFDPACDCEGNPQELRIHLMACYIITHYHNGTLNVNTEEESGETIFTLTFPLKPKLRTPRRKRYRLKAKH